MDTLQQPLRHSVPRMRMPGGRRRVRRQPSERRKRDQPVGMMGKPTPCLVMIGELYSLTLSRRWTPAPFAASELLSGAAAAPPAPPSSRPPAPWCDQPARARPRSEAPTPQIHLSDDPGARLPSSRTSETALALNSSLNSRRSQRGLPVAPYRGHPIPPAECVHELRPSQSARRSPHTSHLTPSTPPSSRTPLHPRPSHAKASPPPART